ncbi:hypothetical protein B0E46_17000 [Rhodanobacter sp. B04]|nr:hypothetical protein B0E46_17000 [Rhodanobacter sp. B04]
MLLVRFGAAYVIFCRLFCCAILCFFAYIPASIAWWILSKSVAKPGEINLYTFVGLGISFTGLYFFVLLIYRALTGRGRKEDGGLLPPWAINLFVAAFGVMALLIVMFGIYSGKLPAVLGGISYFCIALAVWSARRNQRARGRFRA